VPRTAHVRKKAGKRGFPQGNTVVCELLCVFREEEEEHAKGARMHFISLFAVLLLVAIAAGIISWDRRSGNDRRGSDRGGRRGADSAAAEITEELASH
jgi:hypothetical protein